MWGSSWGGMLLGRTGTQTCVHSPTPLPSCRPCLFLTPKYTQNPPYNHSNSSPDSTFVNVGMPPAMTSLSSSSQGSGSDSEDDKDWQMVQSEATEPKELRRRSSTSRVVLRKWPSTSTVTGTSPGKRPETMLQQIVKQVVYTRKSTQL